MSDSPKSGAVLFAKDISRVAAFYEEVAGLKEAHRDGDVIVLESASLQLVIHGIPKSIAKAITISTPPKPRADSAVKLVFGVASLSAAREKAGALGGGLKPKAAEFEARGFRACDGYDAEGNVVQFRERAV